MINVDADFCVNENAYEDLGQLVRSNKQVKDRLENQTMLVLPAFESSSHLENEDVSVVPENKAELIRRVEQRTVEAFHLTKYYAGHGPTDYEQWYSNTTGVLYDVEYSRGFEPYVLAKADGLPKFWTRFRGFGYYKRVWVEEAYRMGYRFGVLRDYFVFHIGQSSTQGSLQDWANHEYENMFLHYLDKHYAK